MTDRIHRGFGRAIGAAAVSGVLGFAADYPHPIPALLLIAPLPVVVATSARRRHGREFSASCGGSSSGPTCGASTEVIDPVCRMAVDPARSAGRLVYDGAEYTFCSLDCAQRFAAGPERYASSEAARGA